MLGWLADLVMTRLVEVAAVTITALVAAAAVIVIRAHCTRRALSPPERVGFDVLPSEDFDPGLEEVERYAAQLARTRRAVRRSTSRSAHAIRVRLDAAGDGTVRYRIEGHRRAGSILGTPGFHGIEVRPLPGTGEPAGRQMPPPSDGGMGANGPEPREPSS